MPRDLDRQTKLGEWRDRLERFDKSSGTVMQFCRKERVSQPTFYKWKKKFSQRKMKAEHGSSHQYRSKKNAKKNASARTVEIKPPAFQSVEIMPTISISQNATIRLPGGIEIELGNDLRVIESVIKLLLDGPSPDGSHRGAPSC